MEPRTATRSTKVTPEISKQAEANLSKLGISVSEYLRMSLAKAATGNVEFINYYDTPEYQKAEQDVMNGKVKTMGHNKKELQAWLDNL
jgi:DNA-damage-inducible protein J